MKIRRRLVPALLLLLSPTTTTSAVIEAKPTVGKAVSTAKPEPGSLNAKIHDTPITPPKAEVGTKDAPVDGLDGKPHAGPFVVEVPASEKKKGEALSPSTPPGKPAPIPLKGSKSGPQEVEDGVMNDKNRPAPKIGTTGTEGGVTEKDKDRKIQEVQTGEKAEKKVDPPKEAPPLPGKAPEGSKGKETTKEKTSKEDEKEEEAVEKTVGGLEVRIRGLEMRAILTNV
jgi:hypothetical protein